MILKYTCILIMGRQREIWDLPQRRGHEDGAERDWKMLAFKIVTMWPRVKQ